MSATKLPQYETTPQKIEALHRIREAYPSDGGQTQRQRLREALSQFGVTSFEAMRYLDCYDPRPRITELRQSGVRIKTVWVNTPTEGGRLHRIGMWVLEAQP